MDSSIKNRSQTNYVIFAKRNKTCTLKNLNDVMIDSFKNTFYRCDLRVLFYILLNSPDV